MYTIVLYCKHLKINVVQRKCILISYIHYFCVLLCLQYIEVMLFKIYFFSIDVFQAVTNFILQSIFILCLYTDTARKGFWKKTRGGRWCNDWLWNNEVCVLWLKLAGVSCRSYLFFWSKVICNILNFLSGITHQTWQKASLYRQRAWKRSYDILVILK